MSEQMDDRLMINLGPEVATETRALAAHLGVSTPEAVRRGLTLLKLYASLSAGEELVVWNKHSGRADRLRFDWGPTQGAEPAEDLRLHVIDNGDHESKPAD